MNGDARVGIAALGVKLPSLAMDVEELAALRGVDPAKYTIGLGCGQMALTAPTETVVDIAVPAAERALEAWGGSRADIGLLVVGTESALDMSRPLSAWVAEGLGLSGAVRSYEVKHACYGGTLALRNAVEWQLSGASEGRSALVVAADVALYGVSDPGEPTQGAGAVAMVVGEPALAEVAARSITWSEPSFDFWRPVGEAHPRVDGALSTECYSRGLAKCLEQLADGNDLEKVLDEYSRVCLHVPFPKMPLKAFRRAAAEAGWEADDVEHFVDDRVLPTFEYNRLAGNAYTASLWLSVARALEDLEPGDRLLAYSYGSGFGAELLELTARGSGSGASWKADIASDCAWRRLLTAAEYEALRAAK